MIIKPTANSTLAIGGVSSPLDSLVVAESSVLRTNFYAENPAHQQCANRYTSIIKTKTMTETLRRILVAVNSLAFAGAASWTIFKFDYEPLITALVLIATLIGLCVSNPKEEGEVVIHKKHNVQKN